MDCFRERSTFNMPHFAESTIENTVDSVDQEEMYIFYWLRKNLTYHRQ